MKKRIIGVFIICGTLIGCNKIDISTKQDNDIQNLPELKNYTIIYKKQINDSIYEFEAVNNKFSLAGEFNFIKKYKTGWWRLKGLNNKKKYKDIEYYKEPDKKLEFKNQYIFYKKNKIDTLKSKFYTKNSTLNNLIIYNFYFPHEIDSIYSTELILGIKSNNKPLLNPTYFDVKKIKEGKYQYNLNLTKYVEQKDIYVIGFISEYSKNDSIGRLGANGIFLIDSIRLTTPSNSQ